MKNTHINQAYFSTSQAAKVLGLSVGTVQRMVENGVFKAFITQGGHRRILSSSLSQYCRQHGCQSATPEAVRPLICVLHDSQHHPAALRQLDEWEQVEVITHPLDLLGIHQTVGAFFIDARIPWLHTSPLDLQEKLMQNAHIVVYNSKELPPSSPLHLSPKIRLFEGDISTDLVFGYLLGTAHAQDEDSIDPNTLRENAPMAA